jgi:hypothetical protein
MSPQKMNADVLRAALRTAEERLKETLKDLETNDMDDQAVAGRLKEIVTNLRRLSFAA